MTAAAERVRKINLIEVRDLAIKSGHFLISCWHVVKQVLLDLLKIHSGLSTTGTGGRC